MLFRSRPDQLILLLSMYELIVHLRVTVEGAAAMVEKLNVQGFIKNLIDRSQTSITRSDLRKLLLSHMSCVFATPACNETSRESVVGNSSAPKQPARAGHLAPAPFLLEPEVRRLQRT